MSGRHWMYSLALGMAACGASAAQERPARSDDAPANDKDAGKLTDIRRGSHLIGHNVVNLRDEKLGTIKDIVVDTKGKAKYVVVDHGGILADKYVAIPWRAFKPQFGGERCVFDSTIERIQGAPTFERANYYERWNKDWCAKVHDYFGVAKGTDKPTPDKAAATDPSTTIVDEAKDLDMFYASQIIGATVQNEDQQKLAKVSDLLFDSNNRVAYAVVGSGGVLGAGKTHVAVPFDAIKINKGEKGTAFVTLNVTATQLEAAPAMSKADCSDMLDSQFAERTRQYFTAFKPKN